MQMAEVTWIKKLQKAELDRAPPFPGPEGVYCGQQLLPHPLEQEGPPR